MTVPRLALRAVELSTERPGKKGAERPRSSTEIHPHLRQGRGWICGL